MEGPVAELKFELNSSRNNIRKKNEENKTLQTQYHEVQKVLRRSIRENKKLNKFIQKERKKFILKMEEKDNIIDAEGLLATCIQHEIDHLNGILFIDHISKLKREIILKKAIKEYTKN